VETAVVMPPFESLRGQTAVAVAAVQALWYFFCSAEVDRNHGIQGRGWPKIRYRTLEMK
jgi:hypothetical protein